MLGNPLILCAYYFPAVDDNLFCEFHHSNSAGGFIYAHAGEGRGGEGKGEGEERGGGGGGRRSGREGKERVGMVEKCEALYTYKYQASLVKSGICMLVHKAGVFGMVIHESSVVSFLPCLVTFFGIPSFSFLMIFLARMHGAFLY